MPTTQVGLLHTGSEDVFRDLVTITIESANEWLRENDYVDDIVELKDGEKRYANDDLDQLEDDADDLVDEGIADIILAAGGPQSAIAARDATADAQEDVAKRIPVVFTTVVDPEALELVDTLTMPGKNLTGMAGQTSENDPRRLYILRRILQAQGRNGRLYGVLVNPSRQKNRDQFAKLKQYAKTINLTLIRRRASNLRGIKRAFNQFRKKKVAGVLVTADSFFNNKRKKIIEEAAPDVANGLAGVPTIYQWKEFTDHFDGKHGGLISFGPDMTDAYKKAGIMVGQIASKQLKPSNIPCSTPDESLIQIWVDLGTATANQFDVDKIPDQIDAWKVNKRP